MFAYRYIVEILPLVATPTREDRAFRGPRVGRQSDGIRRLLSAPAPYHSGSKAAIVLRRASVPGHEIAGGQA